MPNLYVTIDAGNVYKRPYLNQSDADTAAASESGVTAVQGIVDVPRRAVPGHWHYDSAGQTLYPVEPPMLTGDALVAYWREKCKGLLRKHENIGGLMAVWHAARQDNVEGSERAGVDDSTRSRSYGRWLEANVRAVAVDANLLDPVKRALLVAECSLDGPTWYWLHKVNDASGWYDRYSDNNRENWDWYYTVIVGLTPNTAIATLPAGAASNDALKLELDTTIDWVLWLR